MSGKEDAVALFGTEGALPERRLLRAGPLSAILEQGNLRTIRYGDAEIVRAINYLARDGSWGTYAATLSNMAIEESGNAFSVAYDGLCAGPEGRFGYRMRIAGDASGRLTMEADGEALTDFRTNRTGFVVLHPAEAAGGRLSIRHSDGRIEETVFPLAISADQPAFDISALTHEAAPGLTCTVAMEGDAFEMEDQRNWADASFKTYVRPLSRPRPYTIAKGGRDAQKVSVAVSGKPPVRAGAHSSSAVLTVGAPAGAMPSLALFVDPDDLDAAIAGAGAVGMAQSIIVRFDPARGHDGDTLAKAARFAAAVGASVSVEAVFDACDPAAEAAFVAGAIHAAKLQLEAVLAAPRREFKTRPSATLPPGERPIGELVAALRDAGVSALIGAGTPSYFTELNRNPPDGDFDFAFFSIASNVHAADDVSIMETIGVYPAIVESARKLAGAKPIWLGPCTIAMRHNPYGASVAANPHLVRKAGTAADPRHGALFGAAFATGVAASAARAGVDRLILAAPTGPFGLVGEGSRSGPIQAVHAILAGAAGSQRHQVTADRADIAAVGFSTGSAIAMLIANLAPDPVALKLHAVPSSIAFVAAKTGLQPAPAVSDALELGPYRTVFATF